MREGGLKEAVNEEEREPEPKEEEKREEQKEQKEQKERDIKFDIFNYFLLE